MRLTLLPLLCVIAALACVQPVHGLSQAGRVRPANAQERETPLDVNQLRELIEVMPDAGLASQIMKRGINFTLSESLIAGLKGAGTTTLTTLRSFLSNKSPVVVLHISNAKEPQQGLRLNAEASDADGDEILYRWQSNTGNISGDGSEAVLDISGIETGGGQVLVTVSVTVSDRRGGFASDSKIVAVESERARAASANAGMSPGVVTEGKYLIITLSGRSGITPGPVGSIEVSLGPAGGGSPEVRKLTGILPGVPCRVDLVGLNNIAEGSFVETPGIDNGWGMVVVRIKVKDRKRVTNFAIGWKLLEGSSAH